MTGVRDGTAGREAEPTYGVLRWARGAVVATGSVGLGLAGHVVAGGAPPATAPRLLLLGAAVLGGVALSGRRWTLGPLLLVLLGGQVVCHVALADAGTRGHTHQHGLSAPMTIAHLLAALATAALLLRGEAWCWRLCALVARTPSVVRLLASTAAVQAMPAPPALATPPPSATAPLPVLRSLLLSRSRPRRGPPAAAS